MSYMKQMALDMQDDDSWYCPSLERYTKKVVNMVGEGSNEECSHVWTESYGLSEKWIDCSNCGIRWEDYTNSNGSKKPTDNG